ncbi:DUF305 domain-containing protein [Kineosporia sp. NBRC 101731]|uniref:DUF305 domain-containing protein n=1 Tax=Kineosporia sp. NBRC 101731 TaxID=3032199 RepID=UPI0024A503A6|nr:DUF305 domain-containing protein [Kineosporia sp. NBRC 101731]GLY31329.1 lipoprotein [Kineosporia sp. NBRC 101731]
MRTNKFIVALAVLVLTGCAGTSTSTADHTRADVTFATGMIPHHGQALTMADLALDKAESPQVRKLAEEIKAAQDPEIVQMSGLLKGWNQPVPTVTGHVHDMVGMSHQGSGMMTAAQMIELENAKGATFDREWTEMMIQHHQGAVAMSETVLDEGSSPAIETLAGAIIQGQTAEIDAMQALLEKSL